MKRNLCYSLVTFTRCEGTVSMASKPTITREQMLQRAVSMAEEGGIESLSIRAVAQTCDVSVGTVYNYFASKADLVANVVEKYWRDVVEGFDEDVRESSRELGFVEFCKILVELLAEPMRTFSQTWVAGLHRLDARSVVEARKREAQILSHIEKVLVYVLENDRRVDAAVFGETSPEEICRLARKAIIQAARDEDDTADTLLWMYERALYK